LNRIKSIAVLKSMIFSADQRELSVEGEDLVMVQTPLSSLRISNEALANKVKDIEEKYTSLLEMSEKLRFGCLFL
jgi:hypothetical protein